MSRAHVCAGVAHLLFLDGVYIQAAADKRIALYYEQYSNVPSSCFYFLGRRPAMTERSVGACRKNPPSPKRCNW